MTQISATGATREAYLAHINATPEAADELWARKLELDARVCRGDAKSNIYVRGDIQPYKSMVTGELIEGRKQHRDHLKEHRLVEVGNEPIRETKPQAYNSDEVKREIARQLYR